MLSEKDSIIHYIIPLSFTITDILAGIAATLLLLLIDRISWIIILLPILLTVRGDLTGIFVGVLTTNLKMGSIKPQFLGNTDEYYGLISAILTFTGSNSIFATSILLIYLAISDSSINPLGVFAITVLSFYATGVFSIIITSWVGFFTAKKASKYATDPDKYVYPIVSIINDIMIGIFIYMIAILIKPWESSVMNIFGAFISFISIAFTLFFGFKYRNNYRFKKVMSEAYLALFLGLSFSIVNGLFLESKLHVIRAFPPLLIAYPAFIALLGNMGVMVSSQFTTMLWLGEVKIKENIDKYENLLLNPRFLSMMKKTITSGYLITLAISLLSQVFYLKEIITSFFRLLLTLISSCTIVFLFLVYPISVYLALKLFEHGFDPDNFMISIITTICDTVGLMTLILIGNIIT